MKEMPPAEAGNTHATTVGHAQRVKAPEVTALPAAAAHVHSPSSAQRPPWSGAQPLDAIPSEYRSSEVAGVFVDQRTGRHFIVQGVDAYPVVHTPNLEHRGSIGLKGGGDTDPSARRRQLEQRKAEREQKVAELSGVKTSLEREIDEARRQKDDAHLAVSARETGKRLAQRLLEDLKRKQQHGESDLQRTVDTQTDEVQGWDAELQRAQREVDRHQQTFTRLEDMLRTLTADLERVERERVDADRQLQQL